MGMGHWTDSMAWNPANWDTVECTGEKIECPDCDGAGTWYEDDPDEETEPCPTCRGTTVIYFYNDSGRLLFWDGNQEETTEPNNWL